VTPLHRAAHDGDLAAVRRLLADGLAADARDSSGYTPLLWASFRAAVADQVPVILALTAAGADPDAVTAAGDSSCLMLAVQSGSRPAVEALMAAGAQVDAPADGVTALMVAARAGATEMARLLLALGADPRIRSGRFSAVDYALHGGHEALAELLRTEAGRRAVS
jgi:uncharacterized protein